MAWGNKQMQRLITVCQRSHEQEVCNLMRSHAILCDLIRSHAISPSSGRQRRQLARAASAAAAWCSQAPLSPPGPSPQRIPAEQWEGPGSGSTLRNHTRDPMPERIVGIRFRSHSRGPNPCLKPPVDEFEATALPAVERLSSVRRWLGRQRVLGPSR